MLKKRDSPASTSCDMEECSSFSSNSKRSPLFDDLLSERIGFGVSQIITLAVVCQINFIGGCDQYFAMTVVPVLQTELSLSSAQIEMLGTLYGVGIFIGAIISGFLGDYLGRKNSLVLGGIVQFFVTLCNAVLPATYNSQAVLRLLYGIISGYILPIGILIITEIIPKHLRGRCLSLLSVAFLFGRFYFLLLCTIFMDDLSSGDWRAISLCQLFPMATLILCSIFILDESPRFLISQNNFDAAFKIMDAIGSQNKGGSVYVNLTQFEREGLVAQHAKSISDMKSVPDIFKGLFIGWNLSITWRLILSNVLKFFIGSGITFLMPFFMKVNGEGYYAIFIATLGDIPAAIIIYLIIDMESVGRLRIINSILILTCTTYLFIYFTQTQYFLIGMLLIRFTNYFLTVTSVSIISESYATEDRSIGTGVSSAIGRAVSSASPLIFYLIFLSDQWLSFLVFAGLSLVSFFVTYTYPIDLTNKPLDEHVPVQQANGIEEEDDEEERQQFLSNQSEEPTSEPEEQLLDDRDELKQ